MSNRGRHVGKEDLVLWVSKSLGKAKSPQNIKQGFKKAGIWPYNATALQDTFGPSQNFTRGEGQEDGDVQSQSESSDGEDDEGHENIPDDGMVMETPPEDLLPRQHFFMRSEHGGQADGDEDEENEAVAIASQELNEAEAEPDVAATYGAGA